LRSGQPLQSSDIERPIVIAKGALVTITYEVPGLSLSDQGRALEPGAIGDTISVLNPGSHKTLLATVVSPDRVRLEPGDRSSLNIAAR
jgi:flagella basal body P-ring formation protein FlgA